MRELPGRTLGAKLAYFKRERVQALSAEVVERTTREFADRLVRFWSPYGDPALWKAPPPADYTPGNFRSSWFFSIGQASAERTTATDHDQAPWHIERLADAKPGERLYLSNSAPHAGALETSHSHQAPHGILVSAMEFEGLAYDIARQVAR